jgi:hypothetical protein
MGQQINLYNPLLRPQRKSFSARSIAMTLGFLAVGLCGIYAFALVQARKAESIARDYSQQVAAQREELMKLTQQLAPRSRSQALEADVARLESEVKARQSVLGALRTGELGNTAGFSEFLAALARQALPGTWLTGLVIGDSGNELQVSGRALRPDLVPSYLKALSKEPMMRGRRVTEMKLAAKSTPPPAPGTKPAPGPERYVEFTLTAPLRLADAPAAKGTK